MIKLDIIFQLEYQLTKYYKVLT